MANDIKNIIIRRLEDDNQFHVYFPQTIVDGFQGDNAEEVQEHFANSGVHLTNEDRVNVFNKAIVLDEKGLVPGSSLTKAKRMTVKDFANFTTLQAAVASGEAQVTEFVMVLDASDKAENPHAGWEIVLVEAPTEEGGTATFKAINTSQFIDYAANVAKIENSYTSSNADVDAMVTNDHTHENLSLLNSLTEERFGDVAKKEDLTVVKYGENATTLDNAEGDMIFNVTGVIAE